MFFQANLGKNQNHGFAAGVRRSYVDLFIPTFTQGSDFSIKPVYWDYQTKYMAPMGADEELSLFVYGFNDVLSFTSPDDVAQGSDQDTQGDLLTRYGSHRVIGTWRKQLNDTVSFMLQPSFGYDDQAFNLGDAFNLSTQGYIAEIRSEVAVTPNPHIEFVQGIDFIGGVWGFTFKAPFTFESSQDPLAEREDVLLDGNGTLWSPDVYLKANLKPLKDPDRWLITPSLRINTSILTYAGSITGDQGAEPWERVSLDPRLATRFNVSDTVAFKAASGLYHQPPAL